ncbi:ferric reductase like transmembrane component domain-containing protein [Hirsutella rhossiliensis]|uniref:ferric-chelate reductase (NADPH) n=1 Tax=Hirsutella rhossiliensis TaxID=111463 RepID=A0A9P8MTM1_9HYPO|nr:ferric reductase like transmembrane component domain-containing protein [Hirsutella rhossiliensis]KAH0961823.1 ferric reductase like transmembrane component domain-containing protein [Hirsutella rhossiliensis]
MLHSSRNAGRCSMTAEQCAYKTRYWVFWYEADHRYGLPTTALFLATIIVFAIAHFVSLYAPRGLKNRTAWLRVVSLNRLLAYKSWRIGRWNSQSMGVYLLGAVGLIFFMAMTLGPRPYYWPNTREISFGDSPPIATRAGYMALACLPFLLILGTKANPVTALTGISHEKLNVWHNWIAWAMFALAMIHTFPFIVYHNWKGDIRAQWDTGGVWVTGVIAIIAQAWLTIMSIRWIRNRYYEFFKATHFFFAAVFVVFFFLHCDFRMTSWDYFIAAGVLYSVSWFYSQLKTYLEHGFYHRARLLLVTNRTFKIVVQTSAQWRPGQHVYLRFLTGDMHLLAAHPFTICSTPRARGPSEMVFYIQPRGGLTGRLAKMASKEPNPTIAVLLDGPYGSITNRWFDGFDKTLVVGGGAGAGFTLSLIEYFLQFRAQLESGPELTVVIATRDLGLRDWYLEALAETAARHPLGEAKTAAVSIQIYETGSMGPLERGADLESNGSQKTEEPSVEGKESQLDRSGVFDVRFFKGRPDIKSLSEKLTTQEGASVGLVACGPSSMVYDLGHAAAVAQQGILGGGTGAREVWFHKESFSI